MKIKSVSEYDRSKNHDTIIKEYMEQMLTYAKIKYKDVPIDMVEQELRKEIKARFKNPKVKVIDHPSYGNTEIKEDNLLNICVNMLDKYIVTPSGTLYYKVSEKKSFISKYIANKLWSRKVVKKEELDLEARGETLLARLKNFIQTRIKIFVNAISGAMNSAGNILFDPAGYAAITSIARHGCMTAYAHTERFLENNYYFRNSESVINYLVLMVRHCPNESHMEYLIDKYNLYVPTPEDLANNYIESLKNYTINIDYEYIFTFCNRMEDHQRAYAYYCYNLHNLFRVNKFSKEWMDDLFIQPELPEELDYIDPKTVFGIEDDLFVLSYTIFGTSLLNDMVIEDAVKQIPDQVRKFIYTTEILENKINQLQELFGTFFADHIDIPDTPSHKDMIRKTVKMSDTDSDIFTTVSWVRWKLGKFTFCDETFNINALVVYLLSRSLMNVFANMSCNIGMEGENLRAIKMKPEFVYPVMVTTSMSKHYISNIIRREGRKLPKPKRDIKGKNLRGSTYCKRTLDFMEKFYFEDIIEYYQNNLSLSAVKLIRKICIFEKRIKDITLSGDSAFLQGANVNKANHYSKPLSSPYFYYLLWDSVFANEKDESYLPGKYKIVCTVPINLKTTYLLDDMKNQNEAMYKRFIDFLKKYPKRTIESIYIPAHLQIPKEITDIIDYRKTVHSNCYGIYLVLQALNIGIMMKNQICLLTDTYGEPELDDDELEIYNAI
jgi:hypothetical protein